MTEVLGVLSMLATQFSTAQYSISNSLSGEIHNFMEDIHAMFGNTPLNNELGLFFQNNTCQSRLQMRSNWATVIDAGNNGKVLYSPLFILIPFHPLSTDFQY
ncbi:hypothetical protein BDB01DRAFT_894102 [Pilobolus umbonatus]|nr:hypothetical protein BDB01DRAFT_894102 [Pilobolus umbonatus]